MSHQSVANGRDAWKSAPKMPHSCAPQPTHHALTWHIDHFIARDRRFPTGHLC